MAPGLQALYRQGLADLRTRGLQSLHLFLIAAAAAATVTMAATSQRSAAVLWDRIFEEGNGAHATFTSRAANPDLGRIGQMEGVIEQSGPHAILRGVALMPDPRKLPLTLYGVGQDVPTINRPLLKAGRWLDTGSPDEIVLDANYAQDVAVRVGDRVEVRSGSASVSLMVVGFALNAGTPYPPDVPTGYVAPEIVVTLDPNRVKREETVSVRLADPSMSDAFIQAMHDRFPPGTFAEVRDWMQTRASVVFSNEINLVALRVASVFALLAMGMIVAISCSAFILARYRDIGLLKAIGFTPNQVMALFMLEHLGLGFLGGIVGIALGALLSPFLFASPFLQRAAGEFLAGTQIDGGVAVAILVGLEVVVGLSTLAPSWNGGRISTVRAISSGPGQAHVRSSAMGRLGARLRLPLVVVLGISDAFARPLRALVLIVGLAMTIGITTLAFGANTVLHNMLVDPSVAGGPPATMMVQRGPYSDTEARQLLDAHPEVDSYFGSLLLPALATDRGVGLVVRAIGPREPDFRLTLVEGRLFRGPGEAVAPQGLLERLGLELGDDLHLTIEGKPLTLKIVGRVYSTTNFGLTAYFGLESLQASVDPSLAPTEYGLKLKGRADPVALQAALLRESGNQFGIQVATLGPGNDRIGATISVLSVALLLIGLINVFNTTFLGVQERVRDFGVLKAIGMSPTQVVASVMSGAVAVTGIAALLGVPLGILLTQEIWTFATAQLGGGGAGPPPVVWIWVILGVVLVAIALAALGSALPARHAASLQVVEALRHE